MMQHQIQPFDPADVEGGSPSHNEALRLFIFETSSHRTLNPVEAL